MFLSLNRKKFNNVITPGLRRGRLDVAVHRTGACRRPDRELDLAASVSSNVRVARHADAGSCEQSGVSQSVAGIAVAEKTRCIRPALRARRQSPFGASIQGWQGTISGTILGTSASA
jgi:hypothetical protein